MHIGVKKCSYGGMVATVFVDFPKNKCNFLHKNKLHIVRRVQFLTRAASYEEFFSWGSRHHCLMEVGATIKLGIIASS